MDAYVKLFKKHEKEQGEIINFLKEITKSEKEFRKKFSDKFNRISAEDKLEIESLNQLNKKITE
jgi:hypothetical protein